MTVIFLQIFRAFGAFREDSAAAMPRLDDVASVAMERRYNKEADTRIIYQLRDTGNKN